MFHCFSCGAGGTVLDLVAALEGCGLREAALKLTGWFGAQPAAIPLPIKQLVTEKGGGSPRPLGFALRGIVPQHPYLKARRIAEPTAELVG